MSLCCLFYFTYISKLCFAILSSFFCGLKLIFALTQERNSESVSDFKLESDLRSDKEKESEKSVEKDTDESEKGESKDAKDKKKEEPDFEIIENPARVMPAQLKKLSISTDGRYQPLKPVRLMI